MEEITIGLITYNRKKLLRRAVMSIMNQTYKNYKLLIGNDYENEKITFDSLKIKKTKKIEIFNHKKNLGERNNMNYLLNKTKTKWFIWLADDDYFHKELLSRLFDEVNKIKNKNAVACYSNYSRVKLKNKIFKTTSIPLSKQKFLEGFSKKEIRLIGVFGLMKTSTLKKIKGIHQTGKSFTIKGKKTHHYPYCDPLVPIMLSNYGKIIWIDEKLVYLNTDSKSLSSFTKEYEVYLSAEDYVLREVNKVINSDFTNKSAILTNFVKWFLFNRNVVIRKNSLSNNIVNSFKYFSDCQKLINNKDFDISIKEYNFYIEIIKSIIISIKN